MPAGLRSRLEREYVRWTLVQEQIAELEKQRRSALRTATVEIAWGWLRFQPDSELSNWFQERYGPGSRRSRRVGIVALARKLLIALWRYLETGVVPAGAVLKT